MPEDKNKEKQGVANYLKFSGIAIQMAVVITLAAYFGKWLDEKLEHETPGLTITFVLVAIFASLYQLIQALIKLGKDDER